MDIQNNSKTKTVTSVGNSWIVCRSESYAGHIYYFNTLTGKSVWNLSDDELKRALRGAQDIGNYPEPRGPPNKIKPSKINTNNSNKNSTVPNKNHDVDRSFPEPPVPVPSFVAPQATQMIPVGPMIPSSYDPNIWTVPPTHQIFIAPFNAQSQTPVGQIRSNNRNDHGVMMMVTQGSNTQNSLLPNQPLRFQPQNFNSNKEHSTFKKHRTFSEGPQWNTYSEGTQRNFNCRNNQRFNNVHQRKAVNTFNLPKFDLRDLLSMRKQELEGQQLEDTEEQVDDEPAEDETQETQIYPQVDDDLEEPSNNFSHLTDGYATDGDTDWLEDNVKVHGIELELDVSCLKTCGSNPNVKSDCWYIAADKNIFLGHLTFLNVLLNSDKTCHLMIPKKVLFRLQQDAETAPVASGRIIRRARRATDFIQRRLEANVARIGDCSRDNVNDGYPYILDCCLNLADENYHVVLISNDEKLQGFKNSSDVPIFNIKQLQSFLTHADRHGSGDELFPASEIKITVPNDLKKILKFSDTTTKEQNDTRTYQTNKPTDSETKAPEATTVCETPKTPEAVPTILKSPVNVDLPNKLVSTTLTEKVKDCDETQNKSASKIRLKRNTSVTTNTALTFLNESSSNAKQFKWRGRRQRSSALLNDSQPSLKLSVSSNSSVFNPPEPEPENTVPIEHKSSESLTHISYDDNVDCSESNSSTVATKNTSMKIIEESSTSGIISNSTSNIDSENESVKQNTPRTILNTETIRKCLRRNILPIDNKDMEENLKARSDEWVSRFVQIMEEALGVFLRLSNFIEALQKSMPPPWTVQEATESIKMYYRNETTVADAAFNFSNILLKVSDNKGRISKDITPTDYMEMYGYGVHLIHALQPISSNCEDLDIADKSLQELLGEIRNPLHTLPNDNFGDNSFEISDCSIQVSSVVSESTVDDLASSQNTATQNHKHLTNGAPYRPMPRKRKLEEEKGLKYSFFSNLNLKEKTSPNETNNGLITDDLFGVDIALKPANSLDSVTRPTSELSNVETSTELLSINIVGKLTVAPEYERKLRKGARRDIETPSPANLEACYDDQTRSSAQISADDNTSKFVIENNDGNQETFDDKCDMKSQESYVNDTSLLNCYFKKFFDEIRSTFTQVHNFCLDVHKELSSSGILRSRKDQILSKAVTAQRSIDNIYRTLKNIYQREAIGVLKNVLVEANMKISDGNIFVEYRNIVAKSIDQANILLEAVNIIIATAKC